MRESKNFKVSFKIIWFAIFLSVLFLGVSLGYGAYEMSSRLIASSVQHLQTDIEKEKEKVTSSLTDLNNRLLILSQNSLLQTAEKRQAGNESQQIESGQETKNDLESVLVKEMGKNDLFKALIYIDESGQESVHVFFDEEGTIIANDERFSLPFKQDDLNDIRHLNEAGEPYIYFTESSSKPTSLEDSFKNTETAYYVSPIFDVNSEDRKGAIVAQLDLQTLLGKNILLPPGARAYLLDAKNKVISFLGEGQSESMPTGNWEEMMAMDDLEADFLNENSGAQLGSKHIVSYATLNFSFPDQGEQWKIIKQTPKSLITRPIIIDSTVIAILQLVYYSALFQVFMYMVRLFLKPLDKLKENAQKIGRGNFDVHATVTVNDEIGKLAMAFNDMAEKLQKFYGEISEAKAKDEAILENIGEGLAFLDLKGNILLANRAAEKMLGYKSPEIIGKPWDRIVQVKDSKLKKLPAKKTLVSKILEAGKKKQTLSSKVNELNYLTKKNGSVFPVFLTVSKVLKNDLPIGVVIIFRDITKETEVDKTKNEFISLVSHQLKTPSSAINWLTERVLKERVGKLNKKQKEYVENVQKTNQRIINIVNALLNVSRMQLGAFSVTTKEVLASDLIKKIVEELTPLISKEELKLKEVYSDGNEKILLDESLFRIVVQNILANAIRYTPTGGKIMVKCSFEDEGNVIGEKKLTKKSLIIEICDSGYGIPKNERGRLFTKFYRASNIKDKDTDGTGLGLYIVKLILANCMGSIWFNSEEGEGTTFYISIPATGMRKKKGSKTLVY